MRKVRDIVIEGHPNNPDMDKISDYAETGKGAAFWAGLLFGFVFGTVGSTITIVTLLRVMPA